MWSGSLLNAAHRSRNSDSEETFPARACDFISCVLDRVPPIATWSNTQIVAEVQFSGICPHGKRQLGSLEFPHLQPLVGLSASLLACSRLLSSARKRTGSSEFLSFV